MAGVFYVLLRYHHNQILSAPALSSSFVGRRQLWPPSWATGTDVGSVQAVNRFLTVCVAMLVWVAARSCLLRRLSVDFRNALACLVV